MERNTRNFHKNKVRSHHHNNLDNYPIGKCQLRRRVVFCLCDRSICNVSTSSLYDFCQCIPRKDRSDFFLFLLIFHYFQGGCCVPFQCSARPVSWTPLLIFFHLHHFSFYFIIRIWERLIFTSLLLSYSFFAFFLSSFFPRYFRRAGRIDIESVNS